MTNEDVFPEVIIEYKKSFMFGIVRIEVIIEDRKTEDKCRKYKHMINITVFMKKFYIVTRSPSIGHYNMNNDVITDHDRLRKYW